MLVPQDEQNKRLNAARFQLDVMGVPGLIIARTDAEAHDLIEGSGDERDQPFLVGATNPNVPAYKPCFLALIQHFHELGVTELTGHLLYAHTGRRAHSRPGMAGAPGNSGAGRRSRGVVAGRERDLD